MFAPLRQNAERKGTVQQFDNEFRLCAVLALERCRAVVKLGMVFSTKRDSERVVGFGRHATLPPANQMMGIIGGVAAAHARLGLHPGQELWIFPAGAFWSRIKRLRRHGINRY